MHLENLPRFSLAHLPTPIEALENLSRELGGPQLLIKRDDQTGLAFGGNKTRKLEFLVGQALVQGADTLVTVGAAQSNHCRQTAAAAAKAGLKCELILNGKRPEVMIGNPLLFEILGANCHWIEGCQRPTKLCELSEQLRAQGRQPYLIPVGGSNGVGATGYVVAMQELAGQLSNSKLPVDHIVFGSSSGGTHAGLLLGARVTGFNGQLSGLSIDKAKPELDSYAEQVAQLANDCANYIRSEIRLTSDDVTVIDGYKGEANGVIGDRERSAIKLMARCEGIILDPLYAGRAFGTLVDLIRQGRFQREETVLFWHTGGTPVLFAYANELMQS